MCTRQKRAPAAAAVTGAEEQSKARAHRASIPDFSKQLGAKEYFDPGNDVI